MEPLSFGERISIAIFAVSSVKVVWDLWISPAVFNRSAKGKTGEQLTRAVGIKRKRDSNAGVLAFGAIVGLTALLIGEGAMTKEVTREEIDQLERRVEKMEDYFKPPDGGFPRLQSLIAELENTVSQLQQTSASQEDLDNLKKIVAEIRGNLAGQAKTLGDW